MDGSTNVAAQTSTTLFKGAVPPNAFMVRAYGNCIVKTMVRQHTTSTVTRLLQALS
jgi:hypothetical protein